MQQFLKAPAGTARARVVAAEILNEFLAAANHLAAAFHMGFRHEALAPLAHGLEKKSISSNSVCLSIHASLRRCLFAGYAKDKVYTQPFRRTTQNRKHQSAIRDPQSFQFALGWAAA